MADLREAARVVVRRCMAVQPGETVLVVDDREAGAIARALFEEAQACGAEAMALRMLPRERSGAEPPAPVAAAMRAAAVTLAPTSRSLSHTRARREACEAGGRVGTLPGVTEEMMARAMTADYDAVERRSHTVAAALTSGRHVRLTSPLGTDLTLDLEGRRGLPDTGRLDLPGAFGNLPAGEAFIAPLEDRTEGTLVFDACLAGVGVLRAPVRLTVRGGRVTDVEGGPEAEQFRETLERVGAAARVVCELGVGTNEKAQITGVVLEDEKVLGTVHVAFGNNLHFGGVNDVPFHVDGVLTRPTLTVDEFVLIEDGEPRF